MHWKMMAKVEPIVKAPMNTGYMSVAWFSHRRPTKLTQHADKKWSPLGTVREP
jgi:hypothetical protein